MRAMHVAAENEPSILSRTNQCRRQHIAYNIKDDPLRIIQTLLPNKLL